MHIKHLRLVLPARYAGTAPAAAREMAEQLVQEALVSGRALTSDTRLEVTDRGQSPRATAVDLARGLPRKGGRG